MAFQSDYTPSDVKHEQYPRLANAKNATIRSIRSHVPTTHDSTNSDILDLSSMRGYHRIDKK